MEVRRVGRYLLSEPVGRGAMGIVYRAEDPSIHRTVAIKVLQPANGATSQEIVVARERFRREAQAAGGLDHPHVVRIHDVGEEEESGDLYIVMEYLAGPTLGDVLQEGEIGTTRGLEIVGQIAAGLDAAHERGIVHRDVKPSNILFTTRGGAKIVDFGITQVASSSLTQDTAKLGTPAYMSPEQVAGKVLDARADLFSLGVLSYEILTGRRPFTGNDVVSLAYAVAHSQPMPPSVASPGLPRAFDPVFERMLAKDPAQRFASAKEFHDALVRSLWEGSAPAPGVIPRPRGRKLAWWALGGSAIVAGVVLLVLAMQDRVPKPEAPVPIAGAPAPKPAPPRPVVVPKAKLAVSLTHRTREGTLTVTLDGTPVLKKRFSKPALAIQKTAAWDPIQVPVGKRTLRASIVGENGKTYTSEPFTLDVPRGGAAVQLRQRKDLLIITR